MSWFLLLFFIPLVVVPVVLLFGFAGCAQIADLGEATDPPLAPSHLVAKTAGASRISLHWTDNSGGTANFVVDRTTIAADGSSSLSQVGGELPGTFFVDTGLAEGTTFLYEVKAVNPGHPPSVGSNYATATTFRTTQPPTWNTAFEVQLLTNVELLETKSLAKSSMVQRIDNAHLNFGGTKVRITLRGSTQSDLVIDNVSIAPAGSIDVGNPWDSIEDPLEVLAAGSAAITLPANIAKTLDPRDYALDPNKDLLIAFDINDAGGGARKADMPGSSLFFRPGIRGEAMKKGKRALDYNTEANQVFLVEKIEVM
jgi:hypothetical protein